ncbi:MAG: MmcQ/YjbR family DNA-binding protein [bacterium]
MTASGFRKIALSMPETVEAAHMGHPDFRVGGKIFATLAYPDTAWAMVKLTPEQQDAFARTHPKVFQPVKGGWGARGATNVRLAAATAAIVRVALHEAWRNVAPKRLLREHDGEA